MSVDYWSLCIPLPAARARALCDELAPAQLCHDLIGPDEETLLQQWDGVRDVDVRALSRRYAGARPNREFWEGAWVQLLEDHVELAGDCVMTNRSSALSGLDRVIAIPAGVELMSGHAVAHLKAAQLRGALDALGPAASVARALQPYLYGNANEGAAKQLLDKLYAAAAGKQDVVLLSAVPP
jgi:hypothetical protein